MSVNDVTGDRLVTSVSNDKYKAGWDAIWSSAKAAEALDVTDEEDEAWKETEREYD